MHYILDAFSGDHCLREITGLSELTDRSSYFNFLANLGNSDAYCLSVFLLPSVNLFIYLWLTGEVEWEDRSFCRHHFNRP